MKKYAVLRIVLFSIAILVLVGILIAGLSAGISSGHFSISLGNTPIDGTAASSGSVSADEVRNIEIEWAAGSITIQPGDTDVITFSETEVSDEKNKMIWKQDGDTLAIQFCQSQVFFGISFDQSKDLTITVPQDWICNDLDIDSASAEVEINDLTIRKMDFDGASGICTFNNCDINELSVDTASGDVEFSGTLNTLDCSAASAKCTLLLKNTPRQIDVDTMSGDLDITLPADCGFTVTMDAMSSDFTSDFDTTSSNGTYTHGDGNCRISIDAMSGDVAIHKGE